MIYVAGDSHIHVFDSDPRFKPVELGAATAHNLKERYSTTASNLKLRQLVFSMAEGDKLILAVGEVDCRFHIYHEWIKRNTKGLTTTEHEIIDETISNYLDVLDWLHNINIDFYVLSITPVGTYDRFAYDTKYFFTTRDKLAEYYSYFNRKLRIYCQERKYKYLDIYSKTADENGFLKQEYAADAVHLNAKALPLILELMEEQDHV